MKKNFAGNKRLFGAAEKKILFRRIIVRLFVRTPRLRSKAAILWNSNLPQRQVADIILDLGAAVQLKDSKNILQEIVKLFSLY